MSISLQMRRVGEVVVIACSGKIVGGSEADELQQVIGDLLPLEPTRTFALHQGMPPDWPC